MTTDIAPKRKNLPYRIFSCFIAVTFISNVVLPPGYAQLAPQTILNLPAPGTMVSTTAGFTPVLVKGITIHPENPLQFDFIVDPGQSGLAGEQLRGESTRLIKYFLASLTVPEDQLWVNLSPYEKDRITGTSLGATEMGRDMLAQDYILKQLMASLMYPEKELGKKFWDGVYKKAQEQFGTTQIPMDTFNKVWIVPDKAVVYQHGNSAFVVENSLKVMLEQDYQAMSHNVTMSQSHKDGSGDVVTTGIIREVIIPAITKEVNEGQTFAQLRQIYNSMILAAWYKQNLRESLLGRVYIDQAKTKGVDVADKQINEKIYRQYLEAFKKGVYNYIKEDRDPVTRDVIPRKYFSGGVNTSQLFQPKEGVRTVSSPLQLSSLQRRNLPASRAIEVKADLVEHTQRNQDYVTQAQAAAQREKRSSSPIVDYSYWTRRLNLEESDLIHMKGLMEKFAAEKIPLGIGKNFLPSALLTTQERTDLLGAVDYQSLVQDAANSQAAKDTIITLNPMDGGLGTSVKRENYLEKEIGRAKDPATGRVPLSAKATDLFFNVKQIKRPNGEVLVLQEPVKVSIAEIKLLHVIEEMTQFGSVFFQPLVNIDSAPSYIRLLDSQYLPDRVDPVMPEANKRTYRQVMAERGVRLVAGTNAMLFQKDLPVIDLETNELTDKYTAPGGHGQWGVRLLMDALNFRLPNDGKHYIRAFFNGDGVANFPDTSVVGWMAQENVPVVMISTTKTGADKKGGQLGVQITDADTRRPQILELAQAKKAGQADLFSHVGLEGLDKVPGDNGKEYTSAAGEQYFNTNIAILNYNALTPVLNDLANLKQVEFNGETLSGRQVVERIVSPDLIENKKEKADGKEYTQLEGAIGSSLLNLNAFFATTKDQRVKDILTANKVTRILRIVNVDTPLRTKFFTPVKNAFDFWFQAYSDYYTLDTEHWALQDVKERAIPPAVNFTGPKRNGAGDIVYDREGKPKSEDFYDDVQNVIEAFGTASTKELSSLTIEGKVGLKNAVLKGHVEIHSQYPFLFDLNSEPARRTLGQEGKQPLVLYNMKIGIAENGSVTSEYLSSSPVSSDNEDIYSSIEEAEDVAVASSPVGKRPGVPGNEEDRAMIENSQMPGSLPSTKKLPDLPLNDLNGGKATQSSVEDIVGDVSRIPASSPLTRDKVEVTLVPKDQLAQAIAFGTSGWRTQMDGKKFTLHNAGRVAQAIASVFEEPRVPVRGRGKTFRFGVTYGGRRMSQEAAQRAVEVLTANGMEAVMGEAIATTPTAMALTGKELGQNAFDAVLHFDASHNPVGDNGMKFFVAGVVAPDSLTALIAAKANDETSNATYQRIALFDYDIPRIDVSGQAMARYRSEFPALVAGVQAYQRQHPGMKIVVDALYGSSGRYLDMFKEMGATIIRTEPLKSGTYPKTVTIEGKVEPYRPEPKREVVETAPEFKAFVETAAEGSLYFAIDGDADRLAAWVKKDGEVKELLPNDLGVLFGWYLIASGQASGTTQIVKTLPTTSGMDALARWAGKELVVTPVGSKHFAPYLDQMAIATEESGHQVIRRKDKIWFDDAVVEAMLLLEIMTEKDQNPASLLNEAQREIGYSGVYRNKKIDLDPALKETLKGIFGKPRELAAKIQQTVGQQATKIFVTTSQGKIVTLDELEQQGLGINVNEGIHLKFSDGSWVQPRLSGTEPIARIYSEASTQTQQERLSRAAVSVLGLASSPVISENSSYDEDEILVTPLSSSPVTTVVTEGLLVGIHKAIESLWDQDLRGVRVMVRANLNVPISDKGEIEDTTRIVELFPLLDFLKEKDAIVILIGHKGRDNDRVSVKPVRNIIANRYPGVPVSFYDESITADGLHVTRDSLEIPKGREREAGFHILDNVRFALDYEQGEKGSPQREKFGKDLAKIADIFIFEAAGDLASEGASVEDLPRHFAEEGGEVFVGPATIKETEMLDPVVRDGIDAIIFGGKKEDKVGPLVAIMKNLSSKIQFVLLGSSSSNAITEGNVLLKKLSETYPDKIVEAKDYDSPTTTNDIGDKTIALYLQKLDTLRAGQTVLVNGTMGWVEEEYRKGTEKVFTKLKELAQRGVRIVVIGGDGSSNARRYGLDQQPNVYLFTGGGVQLKRLAGKKLVGVAALQQAYTPGIAAKARRGGLLRLIARKLRLERNRNGGKVLQDTITSLQAFKESFLDQIETIEQNLEKAASSERKREVMAASAQHRSQILNLADDLIEGQKLLAGEDVTVLSEQREGVGQIDRKIAEELGYSFASASSPVESPEGENAATVSREATASSAKKLTVLLVEDDEDIREIEKARLLSAGYKVIEAANGQEALDRMTDSFDLLVTDLRMPKVDGLTVIQKMQEGPKRGTPVILLTATPLDSVQMPKGVTVLTKPIPMQELLGIVAEKIKSSSPVSLEAKAFLESLPMDAEHVYDFEHGAYSLGMPDRDPVRLTAWAVGNQWFVKVKDIRGDKDVLDTMIYAQDPAGMLMEFKNAFESAKLASPGDHYELTAATLARIDQEITEFREKSTSASSPINVLVMDTRGTAVSYNSPGDILQRQANGFNISYAKSAEEVEKALQISGEKKINVLISDRDSIAWLVRNGEPLPPVVMSSSDLRSMDGQRPADINVVSYERGYIEDTLPRAVMQAAVLFTSALAEQKAPGGIDLNPALLDLQIKRDANFVPLPLPQQPLREMHIEGFIPVIINITPVTNLPLLLGLADTKQDTEETRPAMKAREMEEISALN